MIGPICIERSGTYFDYYWITRLLNYTGPYCNYGTIYVSLYKRVGLAILKKLGGFLMFLSEQSGYYIDCCSEAVTFRRRSGNGNCKPLQVTVGLLT